ncbi:hypothetical protein B0H19DRAFT_1172429 [Mycena capillaripes]|nr:hypothetical protein B0H19DRAFT_1172429 [Mycena capillaripes]
MQQLIAQPLLGDSDIPDYQHRLGKMFFQRYKQTENLDDLQAALLIFQKAVDGIPDEYPDHVDCLQDLGAGLIERYRGLGDLQ